MHLEYEDEAIDYASPLHTNSELCRSIAIKWLTKCITEHTKCREQHTKTARLPARLIDVGLPTGSQQPRLVLTSELGSASNFESSLGIYPCYKTDVFEHRFL